MNINQAGLDIIKSFEGLRTKAYLCPAGVWTIGYGHTGGVQKGQSVTAQQAEEILKQDVAKFEQCVQSALRVPVTENQFSALVSFAFNIGCGAFAKSTLCKLINARNPTASAEQFGLWVNAGGKKLVGLERRRKAERALFERN